MSSLPQPILSGTPEPVLIVRKITPVGVAGSPGQQSFAPDGAIVATATGPPPAPIIADAVIEEDHDDEMVITEHPVEQGSSISDHAYALPVKLQLVYGWSLGSPQNTQNSANFLKDLYTTFVGLKAGRILLSVITGKRVYDNMIISALGVQTNADTENILLLRIGLQEIILTKTQTVALASQAQQAFPELTSPDISQGPVNLQPAPAINLGSVYQGGGTNVPLPKP